MRTSSPNIEAARVLNGIRNRDILARVLVEQVSAGRIEGRFCIPDQSAREGILTTELIECVAALFCTDGILRDGELCLLLGTAQLLYAHLHAPRLLIGRTMPRGIFPPEVFGAEFIGMRAAVVDHRDGVEHVVGCEP